MEQNFPTGILYLIICRENEMALRGSDVKKSPVRCAPPDPQDIFQLWVVAESKKGFFEIVNAISQYCLDVRENQYRLHRPKWSNSQQITLEKSNINEYYDYYRIKKSETDTGATLDTVLINKTLEQNNSSQLFRFEPVGDRNTIVNNTVIIQNPSCSKVIDVPEASMEKGARLIQYKRNGRFNQRWQLVKYGGGCQIRSLRNGLNIDIYNQNKKPGAKIIQWAVTGASNQLWNLQPQSTGTYIIRSVMAPELMLGVQDNSEQDEGRLTIVIEPFLWKIHGMKFG